MFGETESDINEEKKLWRKWGLKIDISSDIPPQNMSTAPTTHLSSAQHTETKTETKTKTGTKTAAKTKTRTGTKTAVKTKTKTKYMNWFNHTFVIGSRYRFKEYHPTICYKYFSNQVKLEQVKPTSCQEPTRAYLSQR